MPDLPDELSARPSRKEGQEPTAALTLAAYRRLAAELEELEREGRARIAERLKLAREHGDIRENAEYDAAKNEQALMEARIRSLQQMLRDPDIVEAPASSDAAGPGMLVTVRATGEDDDSEPETYLLADSKEERAEGARTITTTSPLGSALLGARVGDEVAYEAPGGVFTFEVVRLGLHEH